MEATGSSGTWVNIYLHIHRRESQKSNKIIKCFLSEFPLPGQCYSERNRKYGSSYKGDPRTEQVRSNNIMMWCFVLLSY
jgi:hypothetical protein